MFKVNKSLIKKVYSIIMVSIFLVSSSLSVSANSVEDTNFNINLELLDTVAEPKANYNVETRKERHQRLIAEGYELIELKTDNRMKNLFITGSDGNLYETRVATSTYRQPHNTKVVYGEEYLNIITQSTLSRIIDTALGFIPRVGWIPTALGINTTSLADFLSKGRVTHISNSTLFFYDIEVKLAGTNKYYFVASSERFESAVTATSSGFTQLGTPIQKTVSGFGSAQSANYNRESSLSQIAVNYFVTGGPNNTYVYFEHYTPFTYVRLY